MKTKEEILQEAYGYKFEEEDFLNPAIRITLNAMEKYAQEVVKNLDKTDVIKSVCENCSNTDFNETMGCRNYLQGFKCENFKQTGL